MFSRFFQTPKARFEALIKRPFENPPLEIGLVAGHKIFAHNPLNRQWRIIDEQKNEWTWAMAVDGQRADQCRTQIAFEGKTLFDEHLPYEIVQGVHEAFWGKASLFEVQRRQPLLTEPLVDIHSQTSAEQRALEWLRVSLEVLKKAIEDAHQRALRGEATLLQAQIFSGLRPPQFSLDHCRMILYSLDLSWSIDERGVLHVLAFNVRPNEQDKQLSPDLRAEFGHFRKEAYDQLIDLFSFIRPYLSNFNRF